MAGFTNQAFRIICNNCGADLTFSEMTSTNGIIYNNLKTLNIITKNNREKKFAVQLFGHEPQKFYDAIKIIQDNKKIIFDIIDINFGCPAKKIIKNHDGAYLLNEPKTIFEIVKKCVEATTKPITVKIRAGYDKINVLEISKIIEQAGASAITVHARLATQKYSGISDWKLISHVKKNLKIPVIANGDIKTCNDIKNVFELTECDAVMIARAALNNPMIFLMKDNVLYSSKDIDNKIKIFLEYLDLIQEFNIKFNSIKSFIFAYFKNFPNALAIRSFVNKCESVFSLKKYLLDFFIIKNNY
ncbi:MAG: tRNA-dihydrouridine synthase family protein [Clostridiales bacterium]|jgi:nifR3 family TIM-barrel protein|nr:tRNA-dihydrouridine synthase family protein [Clostridiales bacterium]